MDVETQRTDSGVDPSQLRTAEIAQKLKNQETIMQRLSDIEMRIFESLNSVVTI